MIKGKLLRGAVRKAEEELRLAARNVKESKWVLVFALGRLRDACDKAGQEYLVIAQETLRSVGEDACSTTKISLMVGLYDYCLGRGMAASPEEIGKFPAYSIAIPLRKLHGRDLPSAKEALARKLHEEVFSPSAEKRPTYEDVEKRVEAILGRPRNEHDSQDEDEHLAAEQIDKNELSVWFNANARQGILLIPRIRIARPSPEAIAAAIASRWAELKNATYIKIEA